MQQQGEYVDDRALGPDDTDEFHLEQLAAELAELVTAGDTPLDVAVYGSWGSGKSSLCTLLEGALHGHDDVRFVPFNAWKYADESLQRSFITHAAKQLKVEDARFSDGLYKKTRRSTFTLPEEGMWPIARTFGVIVVVLALVQLLVAAIAAALSSSAEQPFAVQMLGLLRSYVAPTIFSAAFIAVVVAFMGKYLSLDVEESEPSSIERFERLFCDLVAEALEKHKGCERFVFYIDELDRCTPEQVVSVLEALRTFLDIEHCVFVVAADQQVLDAALTQAIPHVAPEDSRRPYYSSGAEYLDKIFQNQVTIPPLQLPRLTDFALRLVRNRSGVWSDAEDLETLVSVLIPSNVTSPRRVKVLLNGFVTTYRVAQARHAADEKGTPDPRPRMLELAKLSTLRLEAPQFYRHMERHPRLASILTTYLMASSQWTSDLQSQAHAHGVEDLVVAYANCQLPTASMLGGSCQLGQSSSSDASSGDTSTDEEVADIALQPAGSDLARRDELLDYLRRTAGVEGPGPDVIFMETQGATTGVSSDLAALLEADAINNKADAVKSRFEALGPQERIAAIRFLSELARYLPGLESQNVVSIALQVVAAGLAPAEAAASRLVTTVRGVSRTQPISVELLTGAFRLASVTKVAGGRRLQQEVLSDARLREPAAEATALELVQEAGPHARRLRGPLAQLLVLNRPGFIQRCTEEELLSPDTWGLLIGDRELARLGARWKNKPDEEEDPEDVSALAKAADEAGASGLLWGLLRAVAQSGRAALIRAWSETARSTAKETGQVDGLVEALLACDREDWSALAALLDGSPRTDSAQLFALLARLASDISSVGGWDDQNEPLWPALVTVWGNPARPADWSDWSPLALRSEPWGSPARLAKHDLVTELRTVHGSPDAPFTQSIVEDFVDAIAAPPGALQPADMMALIAECADLWPSFDAESQARITGALADDSAGAPPDARRHWSAQLSLADAGAGDFPIDTPAVLDLVGNGSAYDSSTVGAWLGRVATGHQDIVSFLDRCAALGTAVDAYVDNLAQALDRLGATEATPVLQELLRRGLLSSEQPRRKLLGVPFDEVAVAHSLAEYLRAASNVDERAYALEVWAEVNPKVTRARRGLTEAFLHMAAGGAGNLNLALQHLDLVASPPAGLKRSLVSTIRERAEQHGVASKARKALIKSGLAREKKSGLLGLRTTLEPTAEEDSDPNRGT